MSRARSTLLGTAALVAVLAATSTALAAGKPGYRVVVESFAFVP